MVVNTGLFLFSPSFFSCALAPSVIRVASDSNIIFFMSLQFDILIINNVIMELRSS